MIFGFGKSSINTDDLVIIPQKVGKTPEGYRAFLVDEGEIKGYENAPGKLSAKDGGEVFYVSSQAFEIEFAPQLDNAPQLGVKAQIEFIHDHVHSREYYRLASFLEGRESNLNKDEITLLAQGHFSSQMLMPVMTAEEWQKARTVFSNELQTNMGLKCHSLSPVFLENEKSLQALLSEPRNKVLLDDVLIDKESESELETNTTEIEKEQREKLLLSLRLGTSFNNVKDWWQGLQVLDEKLQERLQIRLDQSYLQVKGFYLRSDAYLSLDDRKKMKNMAKCIDFYRRSTEALPRIEIQISSLKRSKTEQQEMFETMQLLLEKSRVFNTTIRENCISGTPISQEDLQALEVLALQLEHAIKKRRDY